MQAIKKTGPIYSQETRYELFDGMATKDVNGNDVVIPKSLGVFTVSQLQSVITSAEDKLNAINTIEQA